MRQRRPVVLGTAAAVAVVLFAVTQSIAIALAMFAVLAVRLVMPSSREVAWRKGAEGEEAVAQTLDGLPGARSLHDRRMPRSRANIDHVLVAPTGVWTVDAKNYSGAIETRARGEELWIAKRNRSKLLDQALGQAAAVRSVLASAGIHGIEVQPALCFLGVEWPLLWRPRSARGVRLLSRRGLSELVTGDARLTDTQQRRILDVLDDQLHPAARPHPPTEVQDPPSPAIPAPAPTTTRGEPVVQEWKRYGHHRLYVRSRSGKDLGYVDLSSNAVVPATSGHRAVVAQAAARYLRER